MITLCDICRLFGESKYIGYFVPLIIYLVINYVRNEYLSKSKRPTPRLNRTSFSDNLPNDGSDGDSAAGHQLTPRLPERDHVPYAGLTEWLDVSGQRFYEIANNRRSIRRFDKNKPVDIEVINNCVRAAGTSPSGAHTEPWTFCVIQDANIKEELRDIIETEEYVNYTRRMSRQWATDLLPLKTDHVKEYLTDAPYLIIVFKQLYGIGPDGAKQQHYYNEISTSIAVGVLLTALQCAGLNSLVTTPLNCGPSLRTFFHRPPNEKLVAVIPVGYASADCMIPDLERKPLDDIMILH